MRKKKFLGVRRTLAKFMVLALVATSFSVSGISTPQSVVKVLAAEQWDSTQSYAGGSEVEYNGAVYRAKWWANAGDVPGESDPWELVSGGSSESGGTTDGSLEGVDATETLNPQVGTNVQGITLPANYYNKKVVGYFPNYAINSEAHKNFSIADLQWDVLTHVQYAFGVVNKETYKLEAGDIENDIENKFEDRTFYHDGQEIKMDESLGYYGQFNLMHTLKKMHPDVTVLISTGGWGASEGLWYATQNESAMRTFSASAVEFIRKYGFDGIDIDFEFPSETPLSGNYTDFTESIRAGIADRYAQFIKILSEDLAQASREDGKYYWLTSAVSASSWVLGGQTNSDFLDYLDFVSIMSYDFHGGWNNYVENQANIYPDPADNETASQVVKTLGFEWAYRFYRGKVQSEKILMGVPYYTRGWKNVSGGTNGLHGTSSTPLTNETDNLNLWYDLDEHGNETPAGANPLWHVMNVMKNNSNYQRYWDDVGKVPHIWNSQNNVFLTFEDTESVQERINYVNSNNLGGVLIWVMHGDYDYDEEKEEYVVGDTLTTMLYDQFKAAGASEVTSDIDYTNKALDFSVDFSGKYDHPNYQYAINVTNNTGVSIPAGFEFSFWLPRSSSLASSWGGTFTTTDVNNSFTEVTITSRDALPAGGTLKFEGNISCCFSAAKNFKINGYSMLSEVNSEIQRLNRSYITEANGGTSTEQPTVAPTTASPTTEAPTTTAEPTTEAPALEQPVVPIGVECKNISTGQFTIVMGNPGNGQTYNLYIDGQFIKNISLGEHVIDNVAEGTHTVKLTGVLNGMESEGVEVQVTIPGEVATEAPTQAPATQTNASVEINGYQISTFEEGFRTVYSVDDPDSEVVKAGMLYGIGNVDASAMVIENAGTSVYNFEATDAGKMEVSFSTSATAQSYAMTMKFAKNATFYNTKMNVRAYAKLSDGTYIYSDTVSYTVYKLANYLYQNLLMNNLDSHNYLYDNILSVVDSAYVKKDFAWNNSIVNPDHII